MLSQYIKKQLYSIDRTLFKTGLRDLKSLSLPTFIGLGPGQTGTTWLFKHLAEHPDVFIPQRKEVHYFDTSFNEWPLSYYASLFDSKKHSVRGEISPGYSILDRLRISAIHDLMPDLRLIMTLRNPIERSWSGLRRVMAKSGDTLETLGDTHVYGILEKEWNYTGLNNTILREAYQPDLLEGNYCQCIDNWLSVYSEEQLLVVFFDDMQTEPEQYLRTVYSHIGITPKHEFDKEELRKKRNVNPASSMPEKIKQFLTHKYADEIAAIESRFNGKTKNWINVSPE